MPVHSNGCQLEWNRWNLRKRTWKMINCMFTEIRKEIKSLMNPGRTQTTFWKNEESSDHIWKRNSIKTKTNWTSENEKELKQVKWLWGKFYQPSGSREDSMSEHEKKSAWIKRGVTMRTVTKKVSAVLSRLIGCYEKPRGKNHGGEGEEKEGLK